MTSHYIPALRFHALTPLFDPMIRWAMPERTFRTRLITRARIRPGQAVLDLGSGTGTLALMIKRTIPLAQVTGLDADPKVLSIARHKAAGSGLAIQWDQGMATELPYPENSFDVVVSSLVIHHLATLAKVRAFREVHRVLRPGGSFHAVDFGRPLGLLSRMQGAIMRQLEEAGDNFDDRLLDLLWEAGFAQATESEPLATVFGPLWFYEARDAPI